MKNLFSTCIILLIIAYGHGQSYQIALLKYNGGGDWYANLETSLPNLIEFTNHALGTHIDTEQAIVEVGSTEIFSYPFIHMTGHGNVLFSEGEAENLRRYLQAGGFLHIDDNYGMDVYIRREMLRVFPELTWIEIPPDHPIFRARYIFANGLPKIHAHDDLPPKGYALYQQGRMICFYTYQCDLGDGWESAGVHNDPEEVRVKALKMGANILSFVLMGQ